MHKERRARLKHYGRSTDKAIVMGILERGGKVHAKVVPTAKKDVLWGEIRPLSRMEALSTPTNRQPITDWKRNISIRSSIT